MTHHNINLLIQDYKNKYSFFIINTKDLVLDLDHPTFHNLKSPKNQMAALAYLNLSAYKKRTHDKDILDNGLIFLNLNDEKIHNYSNINLNDFQHLHVIQYNQNNIDDFLNVLEQYKCPIELQDINIDPKTKTEKQANKLRT